MILVTGATGTVGRKLVAELARRGAKVRALSRNPAATAFPAGVEIVAADLGDPAALGVALAGIERVFVLTTGPARLDHETRLITAARQAGAARIQAGTPTQIAEAVLATLADAGTGPGTLVQPTVRELTGRPPCTFRHWASRHAAAFRQERP